MQWVQREELLGYLAGCVTCRLVLVAAPAGSGKTTAVAQWSASVFEDRAFAWISLDRSDGDPVRLWLHVVTALQRASPGFDGGDLAHALTAQMPDVAGKVLPGLVNELAALQAPVVLVLDDYHVISDQSCHDQVAFLLAHLPATVQLVLLTRADPPLPLGRLRAAGEMAEIRAAALRFSAPEAAALVRTVAAVDLSAPEAADLVDRTEGWPAGVYLAALSLRGHPSPGAVVRQFTGDNRFVFDFLAEEVLNHQPAQIRQFLARTAILGRFCAPLCDAVTGSANAAEIIDVIERDNLFLVSLDDQRQWYRYHHLFAQMLRRQLTRTEPAIVPALHQRASTWHRRAGSVEEAIDHALAAGDAASAVDLIAGHWPAYVDIGRISTIRRWMRSLGDDQIRADPVAAHCAAWCAAITGDPQSLRRLLPVIESADANGPLPDGIRSLKSSAALLQASFGFEGIQVMSDSARAAAELESDPRSPWYTLARAALGAALYLSGELEAAGEPLTEALAGNPSVTVARVLALSVLALVRVEQGRLGQAEELGRMAHQLVGEGDLSRAPQSSVAYTATGAVYAGQGRFEQAREEFEHAIQIRRRWPGISPWATVDPTFRLAALLYELGERPAAQTLIDEARQVLIAWPDGAEAQRARLDRLERRFASPMRPAMPGEQLTEREVAVLRLLQGTLSIREIGQELYLSPNTVKTHARAVYRKLGVSTRHDAIARGHDLGIL
jgi:LuxR family transcriptional regulator, maltose regulon positive regulatory protein